MNRAIIIGRLVRDPELRRTQSGTAICSFTVAVDDKKKGNGEKHTSFIGCTAFNGTAEVISSYQKKGMLLCVDGRLSQRTWQSKDGQTRSEIEIIADGVDFLSPKHSDDHAPEYRGGGKREETAAPCCASEEIPSEAPDMTTDGLDMGNLPF